MYNRIIILTIAMLVFVGLAAGPAQAQEQCSLGTMTGTYVFYERGSSLVLDPTVAPFPVHWSGAVAPFSTVGQLTIRPDGLGEGFYWIRLGSLSSGLDPTPVQVSIIEMNPDCTGKFRYVVNLPGAPSATIVEERFIAFDNGREWRSLPTFIEATGVPTLAWIGVGRRVRKSGEPPPCEAQTPHGTYVSTAENIIAAVPNVAFADTILFRLDVSSTGDYTGTLYEKLGALTVELPVFGNIAVSPDCSYSQDLNLYRQGTLVTIGIHGVFFNEGKEFFGLAIGPQNERIKSSITQGVRISQ